VTRLAGLIAATFTPMTRDGEVTCGPIADMVNRLIADGVTGLYVCGSTGEGPSLTTEERMRVAGAFVEAACGRIPVVVQVGHNAVAEACRLAQHAESIGAAGVSAVPPSYYGFASVGTLVATIAAIAEAASRTPFYYYHIPQLSGVAFDAADIMEAASEKIPTLAGIKFSHTQIDMLIRCRAMQDGRFSTLFGVDEMLLSAWAAGCDGAVGSTYNFMAARYLKMLAAFDAGRIDEARALQRKATAVTRRIVAKFGVSGLKAAMAMLGPDCGPTRLPLPQMSEADIEQLHRDLLLAGFSDALTEAR
jgi:N-acetylneuraminate lyase